MYLPGMSSLTSKSRRTGFETGDWLKDTKLREAQDEDEYYKGEAAQKAEMARLENRKIMRGEMAKREENANRPQGWPDLDWKPGIPADMLTREQNPWKTFYDNEALRGNYQALAGEGMPSPGGAHIMGSGDVMGSAGDAERSNTAAQSAAALKSLQTQAGGGGGGAAAGGGGGGGGQITAVSPGGNYSRGPQYDEIGLERLKQAKAQTAMTESLTPAGQATERERLANETAFNINTGRREANVRGEGKAQDLRAADKQVLAAQMRYHPDVHRAEERDAALTAEGIYNSKVAPAEARAAGEIEKARVGAEGRIREQEMRGNVAGLLKMIEGIQKGATAQPISPAHAAVLAQMTEYLKAMIGGQQQTPQIP
jgi:hypothetical protein